MFCHPDRRAREDPRAERLPARQLRGPRWGGAGGPYQAHIESAWNQALETII
jgi:hypothetical protein